MFEYRCKKCKTLLMKESVRDGLVEIKCPRCNTFNTIERIVSRKTVWVDTKKKKKDNKGNNKESS